ncbi:hypothetical protein L1887_05169 [Cichorium endivia]|nr:hypothetical protein L1887_05169 [Cichorium endivia]
MRNKKLHFVSMATLQLVRTILDPKKNWFAALHKKTITERLRKYDIENAWLAASGDMLGWLHQSDGVQLDESEKPVVGTDEDIPEVMVMSSKRTEKLQ